MDRTRTPSRPLSDLVDFLRTAHGVPAIPGPEPGRVVATKNGHTVAVLLVGGRWYQEAATASGGRDLTPIHPRGMEWSVARTMAEVLAGPFGSRDFRRHPSVRRTYEPIPD